MTTIKLIAIIIILVIGVSLIFPDKAIELRNKFFEAVSGVFGLATSTVNGIHSIATSSLSNELGHLPDTAAIQSKKIEAAQKVTYGTPLRATKNQVPVANVVLSDTGVINWTNQARIANSLPSLKVNSKLNAGAMIKIQDMFAKQYFEHISPSGVGPADIAKEDGYEYILIGENLAMGNFKNDQELLAAWMNSPGHRANILNPRFTEIGVAVQKGYYDSNEIWMAVQEFGLPLSSCPNPDANLKNQIESNESYLQGLQDELQRMKSDIANTPSDDLAYNDKVNAYNDRVASYNKLLETTRGLIETYNGEVNAFNLCLEE